MSICKMDVILSARVSKLEFLTRLTTISFRWSGASAAIRDGSTEEGKLATEKDYRIPLARQTEPEREP